MNTVHEHGLGHHHAPKTFSTKCRHCDGDECCTPWPCKSFTGLPRIRSALLADAGHNFGDALGLMLAWGAHVLAKLNPTKRYTYGFRSASILAALINGVILLIATGGIAWGAIGRLFEPVEVHGATVMVVAAIGIVANGIAAWLLMAGQGDDLNIRGAFLHMMADAATSLSVVIAGGAILLTGWTWLYLVASLLISAVIVWGTWNSSAGSVYQLLDAVPDRIDPQQVAEVSARPARCRRYLRFACLGNEHDRDGVDLPPRDAEGPSGRCVSGPPLRPFARQVRHRAPDVAQSKSAMPTPASSRRPVSRDAVSR